MHRTKVAVFALLTIGAVAPEAHALLARYEGAQGSLQLTPPRTPKAPVLDGSLDDEAWQNAVALEAFTHQRPVEGVRDSLGTVCLVMYDKENLYVGFRAPDDPSGVQAPIVPRDQAWQGDWVGVSIDSYHDKQRSFFLSSNPLGIQMDGVDQDQIDTDMAPDFQYTSKGKVNGEGYEVEMAIPFKSLRFPNQESVTFGFNAIRHIRRTGAQLYWAPYRRDVNSYHSQLGALQGFAGIRPGRNIEVNPTFTGTKLGDLSAATNRLRYADLDNRFGLGVKVGLTSNLIADATVTPDFSQVEADAGALDINERFATFFPEKRPFFLEGSDYFQGPLDLVYTRRIVDPRYGTKLTGKQGRTTIGVLHAADRSAGRSIDGLPDSNNPYLDRDAYYSIARFKQDVFKNSYIGLLAGERRQDDQYNRGAGVDGRLRWADRYAFRFQGVGSWSRERDFRDAVAGLTPEQQGGLPSEVSGATGRSRQGEAWLAELSRDTRPLNTGVNVTGFSPEFAADMGFVTRNDFVRYSGWVRPHLWGKEGQWYSAIHFPMYYERVFDYASRQAQDDVFSSVVDVILPRNSWIGTESVTRFIRFNGVAFPRLTRHAVWAGSERYQGVRGGGLFVWGDQVVFAETRYGRDQRWELWSDLRFSSQLDAGIFVRGQSVWRDDRSKFATTTIPRVRVSYQFSKELALRWITEMRSRRQFDAAGTVVSDTRTITPDVLLSYYVRPGTVMYLGYGSLLSGPETDLVRPVRNSIFTKVSYLWRV